MALTAQQIQLISQAKMDAMSGKVMHTRALPQARRRSLAVDYAGAAVPIVLLVMTIVVLRLDVPELAFVIVADIVGGLLLVILLVKVYFKWQERFEEHLRLLDENISLARDADILLGRQASVSGEVADLFLQRAGQVGKRDLEIFGELPEPIRREAYRRALKEMGPGSKCRCGADPWAFVSGPCQICGGTPIPSTG